MTMRMPRGIFALAIAVIPVSQGLQFTPAVAQDAARGTQQQACSRDVSRYCRKQMGEGDSAIYLCLQQNREKLSPSCRKLIDGQ